MESVNVVLVPGIAFVLGRPTIAVELAALLVASLAASGLLVIGALYWFGISRRLSGEHGLMRRWLAIADRAEMPLLIAIALAVIVTLTALALQGWTRSVVAAIALTTLAGLEYINYYHRQLQHFDNMADFKRLISLRPLKRAHSARDLAAYRSERRLRS